MTAGRFFTVAMFNEQYKEEMLAAIAVYEQMLAAGFQEYANAKFEIKFTGDDLQKIIGIKDFLIGNYGFEMDSPQQDGNLFSVSGQAEEFPVDKENLAYWAIDLFCTGFDYDCKFDGYALLNDLNAEQHFPTMDKNSAGYYVDQAMTAYRRGNYGYTIIHLSSAIRIQADDANTWYARAIAKEAIRMWYPARLDYDQAIMLNPGFVDAYINRAANKDEQGEFESAIEDYNTAISLAPGDDTAYYNRGNSKYVLGDPAGALEDWQTALSLGSKHARARIDEYLNRS
ncbi:hypothetical protein COR50_18790 [Chitinophaga caeni]|uniref:Uncharacterized protein n=1 Tax=Chitinophaga caeni TaxID=2029983 RepID=A0A291QYU6_9BACT|nr:tetratricopeptide repeat protein [Chitinophaga caeni]ATL49052.1 hypothetical protein COR50_18790 [Chitinophaga caeni]